MRFIQIRGSRQGGVKVSIDFQRGDDLEKQVCFALKDLPHKELRPDFLKEAESKELRATLLARRGCAYAVISRLNHAIADYDAAIAADPGCVDAWTGRCRTWSQKGDFAKALADANEVIRLKPDDSGQFFSFARGCLCLATSSKKPAPIIGKSLGSIPRMLRHTRVSAALTPTKVPGKKH